MRAFGLYTHIRANRFRAVAIAAMLLLQAGVAAYGTDLALRGFAGGDLTFRGHALAAWHDLRLTLPVALAIVGLWGFVSVFTHKWMIDRMVDARPTLVRQEPRAYRILEGLCISRGIGVPLLHVSESRALNAFATGLYRGQYAITVTRGLLEELDDAELEAVLAHELTHIRNGDVRIMVLAGVVAGVIGFVGEIFLRHARPSGRSRENWMGALLAVLVGVALVALSWLASKALALALSRNREYLADAGAVDLTRNPDAMISALRKVEGRSLIPSASSAVMELCLDNPSQGWSLLSTHPSVDARVKALVDFCGGREAVPAAGPVRGPWGPEVRAA